MSQATCSTKSLPSVLSQKFIVKVIEVAYHGSGIIRRRRENRTTKATVDSVSGRQREVDAVGGQTEDGAAGGNSVEDSASCGRRSEQSGDRAAVGCNRVHRGEVERALQAARDEGAGGRFAVWHA